MNKVMQKVKSNNGVAMPLQGFGVFQNQEEAGCTVALIEEIHAAKEAILIKNLMLFLSCLLVTWAPAANAQGAIQREESAFSTSPDSVTGDDAAQVKVAPPSAKKSIKNELRHESLKRVLSGVTDLKEGKIGNIVSKFSGTETDWVWILREGNLPKDTNAETVPIAGGAITTLDYRKLKGAARLSIARTLIHELVHAYL